MPISFQTLYNETMRQRSGDVNWQRVHHLTARFRDQGVLSAEPIEVVHSKTSSWSVSWTCPTGGIYSPAELEYIDSHNWIINNEETIVNSTPLGYNYRVYDYLGKDSPHPCSISKTERSFTGQMNETNTDYSSYVSLHSCAGGILHTTSHETSVPGNFSGPTSVALPKTEYELYENILGDIDAQSSLIGNTLETLVQADTLLKRIKDWFSFFGFLATEELIDNKNKFKAGNPFYNTVKNQGKSHFGTVHPLDYFFVIKPTVDQLVLLYEDMSEFYATFSRVVGKRGFRSFAQTEASQVVEEDRYTTTTYSSKRIIYNAEVEVLRNYETEKNINHFLRLSPAEFWQIIKLSWFLDTIVNLSLHLRTSFIQVYDGIQLRGYLSMGDKNISENISNAEVINIVSSSGSYSRTVSYVPAYITNETKYDRAIKEGITPDHFTNAIFLDGLGNIKLSNPSALFMLALTQVPGLKPVIQ